MTAIYRSDAGAHAVEDHYRALLRAWPVPSEQLRVPTHAGETFVVACGPRDAPPVLLLHGSAVNSAMWMADAAVWSQQLRLYAVDLPGEPGLSAPARLDLASDAHARWLDDVVAGLGVERPSIVGISLGGWLAIDYATRRPGRVDQLALLCPSGIGRQKWAAALASLALLPFGRRGKLAALKLVLGPASFAATPDAMARGELVLVIHAHFRPRRERLPIFDDAALSRLTAPMFVTVGGRDRLLDSAATRRRLERCAPHATIRFLAEAGHLLPSQTQPILDFLREVRRPDARPAA